MQEGSTSDDKLNLSLKFPTSEHNTTDMKLDFEGEMKLQVDGEFSDYMA